MATIKQGINGAFKGKIGSVIGYQIDGQNIVRMVGKRTKPFTPRELLNQAKIRTASKFLKPIKPYIQFGFARAALTHSRIGAFQLAQSYIYKQAIELDTEDAPYINPEKVLISSGDLFPPQQLSVSREGNRLTFQWEFSGGEAADRLMVLLYDGIQHAFFLEVGAERGALQDTWDVAALAHIDSPMHVYAAFRDTISGSVSSSVYCGAI